MNIYISSSWKNRNQIRDLAKKLTAKGHEVYDFTNPDCRKVPEIPPEKYPEEFDPETQVYGEYIQKEEWRAAVEENKKAIENADLIILLLPCGNDAHSDWAYGVGLGKRSIIMGSPYKGDRSPVHLWASAIADNEEALYEFIEVAELFNKHSSKVNVSCEYTYCVNNKDEECRSEHIKISAEHPVSEFFCAQYEDITQKEDYTNEFYEITRLRGKEELFKRRAYGKKFECEEFVFFTKQDYRSDFSEITEEKSGILVGRLEHLRGGKREEWLNKLRKVLEEHYKEHKPVAEYDEYKPELERIEKWTENIKRSGRE